MSHKLWILINHVLNFYRTYNFQVLVLLSGCQMLKIKPTCIMSYNTQHGTFYNQNNLYITLMFLILE